MNTVESVFKIGPGPSSSHTIAIYRIAKSFLSFLDKHNFKFDNIIIILYGSLALTAKGHHTDYIIGEALKGINYSIIYDIDTKVSHPNTCDFKAFLKEEEIKTVRYISIGGGDIYSDEDKYNLTNDIYPFSNFEELTTYMIDHKFKRIPDLVYTFEKEDLVAHLGDAIDQICETVEKGLNSTGYIIDKPDFSVLRKAKTIYKEALKYEESSFERRTLLINSYAIATSEENALGSVIVTCPTSGSCGVLAGIVYYFYKDLKFSKDEIIRAMMTAGMIGNIIKKNFSVAGAVGGCQVEVGAASGMVAALIIELYKGSLNTIEYASVNALSNFLGLTCDPVQGYVIIPCIERNAVGAIHALNAAYLAMSLSNLQPSDLTLDITIRTMKVTGDFMACELKETSLGGLAKYYKNRGIKNQ